MSVPGKSDCHLRHVQFIDIKTGEVVWHGEVSESVTGEGYMDPFGYTVYERANESFRQVMKKLTAELAAIR